MPRRLREVDSKLLGAAVPKVAAMVTSLARGADMEDAARLGAAAAAFAVECANANVPPELNLGAVAERSARVPPPAKLSPRANL